MFDRVTAVRLKIHRNEVGRYWIFENQKQRLEGTLLLLLVKKYNNKINSRSLNSHSVLVSTV